MYYLPGCPSDAEHLFVFKHQEGELLDGAALLKETPPVLAVPGLKKMPRKVGTPEPAETGVLEGGRNADVFKHACTLFGKGRSVEEVTIVCIKRNESHRPPLDEDEVRAAVSSALKHVEKKVLENEAGAEQRVEDDLNLQFAWVEKQGRVFRFKWSLSGHGFFRKPGFPAKEVSLVQTRSNWPWSRTAVRIWNSQTLAYDTLTRDGETDLLVVFQSNRRGRFALHFENKLANGTFTKYQPDLYRARAAGWVGKKKYGDYEEWQTILSAPRCFHEKNKLESQKYDVYISHEEIAEFVPQFAE